MQISFHNHKCRGANSWPLDNTLSYKYARWSWQPKFTDLCPPVKKKNNQLLKLVGMSKANVFLIKITWLSTSDALEKSMKSTRTYSLISKNLQNMVHKVSKRSRCTSNWMKCKLVFDNIGSKGWPNRIGHDKFFGEPWKNGGDWDRAKVTWG